MPVFRPPSEADSLIIQATIGCSHNKCTFCGMYKMKKFTVRSVADVKRDMDEARLSYGNTRRLFLADGNALCIETEKLLDILNYAFKTFPSLERVTAYAAPQDVLGKSDKELQKIANFGLTMIYLGLESGDDEILKDVDKGATGNEMAESGKKARENGLVVSVTALLGLGGREKSYQHAKNTAKILNEMQPQYTAFLTLMLVPDTVLYKKAERGDFAELTPQEFLQELRWTVEDLDYKTVFRANHASNYLPLRATLPEEKGALLATIDRGMNSPSLLRPEYLRGL
jgi:radical SAM superfamily enzyme YgiQ (UPF0313 family)